jgi:3-deoxy-D-manno-octulosonate 8-phosphate phosphatase (KDO 8-P phosphatase)
MSIPNLPSRFESIRHFVFDIDGVLTDGTIWVMPDGEQVRRMHIKDGFALQLAVHSGYPVLVISGSARSSVENRLHKLGIRDVHFSVSDKAGFLQTKMQELGWDPSLTLYMGDDLPDLPAMSLVGLPACPQDAAPELLSMARYISPVSGGMGCVRDVIEQVLRLNGHWNNQSGISSR